MKTHLQIHANKVANQTPRKSIEATARRAPRRLVAATALFFASALSGTAASATWNGATDGIWEDASNWSAAPYPNGTADIATFDNTSANPVVTVGAITLKQIIFKGASLVSYTIGGGPISYDSTGGYNIVDRQSSVVADQIIAANFNLNATGSNNPNINNGSSSGRLIFNGNVIGNGTGTRNMKISGSNNATTVLNGNFTPTLGSIQMDVANGLAIFNGTSTFTNFTVYGTNSRLIVNGTVTASNANVNDTSSLGGTGSIIGKVNIQPNNTGCGIRPGDGSMATVDAQTGTLGVSGNLGYNNNTATAEWQFQLGGNSPGDGQGFYDQLNVGGSVALKGNNSTTSLTLELVNGYVPANGDIAYIITRGDGAAFTTFFSNYAEGDTVTLGGTTGTITYLANWTGSQAGSSFTGGNDIAILFGGTTPTEPVVPVLENMIVLPADGVAGAMLSGTITMGAPDSDIRIEASTDLGVTDPWETIGTIPLDSNGEATLQDIEDPGSVGAPANFFRIAVP